MKLSVCLVAGNDADRVVGALDSARFCDDRVVLAVGSTDDTAALAQAAGARIESVRARPGESARNALAGRARHDWILWLEPGDRADEALAAALSDLARRGAFDDGAGKAAAYEIGLRTTYLGRRVRHGGTAPAWRALLYDRRRASWDADRLVTCGAVERLPTGALDREPYRSLADHVTHLDRATSDRARRLAASRVSVSVASLVLRPPGRILGAYVGRAGFLDGLRGLVCAGLEGWGVFLTRAKAREIVAERRAASRTGVTEDVGTGRGRRRRDVETSRLDALLEAHDHALAQGDDRVAKVARKSRVTRHGDRIVKEAVPHGWWGRLRQRIAPRRHRAGWSNARRLEELGVATARAEAWLQRHGRFFTIYEDLSSLPRLDLLVADAYAADDAATRAALRDAAADWLADLHARGIYHGDLKGSNVLVRRSPDGPSFPLIDTDRVRIFRGDVDRRRRVKNLAQLGASIGIAVTRSERLRFWRRYARHSPYRCDERGFATEVGAGLARKTLVVDRPLE